MLNFTGSSKKRVVNLGNNKRKGLAGAGTPNYLEQSRLQRLQREEQRQQERAAVVLQSHIRRYLVLAAESDRIQQDWRHSASSTNHNINPDQQPYHDKSQPKSVLDSLQTAQLLDNYSLQLLPFLQFSYVARWCISRQPLNQSVLDLEVLQWHLAHLPEDHTARLWALEHALTALVSALYSVNRTKGELNELVRVIELVVASIDTVLALESGESLLASSSFEAVNTKLIDGFVSSIKRTQSELPPQLLGQIVSLVFQINAIRPLANFVQFLSIPRIFGSSTIEDTNKIVLASADLATLDKDALICLLVNFLDIHGETFTPHDFHELGSILELVNFSVYSEDDDSNGTGDSEDTPALSPNSIAVSESAVTSIQVLYSSQFVNQAMTHFLQDPNPGKSQTAFKIISALFILYPSSQSKLSMWITITPGAFKWFHHELQKYGIYHVLKEVRESGRDYMKLEDLKQYEDSQDEDSSIFWKSLYTFEELYSFWLIVSNDLESFSDDKLNLEEVYDFLKFLRSLCLTLIFIPREKGSEISSIATKLRSVTTGLLNQLYLKNLRLKFLPDDFWSPKALNFNIDALIQIIVEEQNDNENQMDVDDDVEFRRTIRAASGGLISPFQLTRSHVQPAVSETRRSYDLLAKLEILKDVPFFIPFKDRVRIFQVLIELDKRDLNPSNPFSFNQNNKIQADIRREHLLEDAFNAFHKIGTGFKNQIQVIFFNEYGGQEAGIDGGGITKEFLTSVAEEAFSPSNPMGLFKETSDHQIYPNDEIFMKVKKGLDLDEQQKKLVYLNFLGKIIGKCLYENVLIDVSFSPFFLNKWGKDKMKNSINDLGSLDNELFQNLMKLEKMTEEEILQLDLNFTVNENIDGKSHQFEIIKDGESVQVTEKNKLNYIHQISNFKLNLSLHLQSRYFKEGLEQIISPDWLKMFDSYELQMLISGGENDVNIQDWKDNVEYGGFFDDDLTIHYFWEVIKEMTAEERFKLIKFVTSVSRAPLLGFGALSPKFGIRNSGKDLARLPTASTCVNLLKLPDYQDKKLVREKLLYAINGEARFDLS